MLELQKLENRHRFCTLTYIAHLNLFYQIKTEEDGIRQLKITVDGKCGNSSFHAEQHFFRITWDGDVSGENHCSTKTKDVNAAQYLKAITARGYDVMGRIFFGKLTEISEKDL